MNARQFKKLCKRSYDILLLIDPACAERAYTPKEQDDTDGWFKTVLKGTKGFGGMDGYYEPEWSDRSAWSELKEHVYWHFAVFKGDTLEEIYPSWPEKIKPRSRSDYFKLANQIIAAKPQPDQPAQEVDK